MITLTQNTIDLIRAKKPLFIKVQAALEISEKTMYNYLDSNSENLTKLSAIDILVSETGKPLSELVNNIKANKLMAK